MQTSSSSMLLPLVLFILWLVLNLTDIFLSLVAIQAGAIEIGLLYQASGNFLAASINKMILAILIGIILVYLRKSSWLALLNLGMVVLCIYNGSVLLKLL
jgi:hypothetical protein